MVKRFAAFFGGGNGNQQIILDLILPDEFRHLAGAKAGFDDGYLQQRVSPKQCVRCLCPFNDILLAVLYHNESGELIPWLAAKGKYQWIKFEFYIS